MTTSRPSTGDLPARAGLSEDDPHRYGGKSKERRNRDIEGLRILACASIVFVSLLLVVWGLDSALPGAKLFK